MINRFFSYCYLNIYAAFFTLGILAFALYTEYYQGLNPCPLCVMQRIVFIALAFIFIVGTVYRAGNLGRKLLHGLGLLIALFGIALAARQIYLQHLPIGTTPSCGPGFNFIVQNLPLTDAIRLLLQGSGECALVNWQLLGLSMAEWSLLCFILLAVVNIFQMRGIHKQSGQLH